MSENIEERLAEVQDISASEKEKRESGLELARGKELDEVVKSADNLAGKIESDENVKGEDVLKLEEALGKVKVNVYGEELIIEEIRKIPDWRQNMEIWHKIMAMEGSEVDVAQVDTLTRQITFLPVEVAQKIITFSLGERLNFPVLKTVSSKTASVLATHEELFLGIEKLSSDATRHLGQQKGVLYMSDVKYLSDEVVRYLSLHKGRLYLPRLEDVSDQAIKLLAKMGSRLQVGLKIEKRINEIKSKKFKFWR